MKKKIFALCLIFASIFMFVGCDFNVQTTTSSSIETSSAPSNVVQEVIDSVVTVFVVNTSTNTEMSMGSGVCIRVGGYIVTNYHVVYSTLQNSNLELVVYLNGGEVGYSAKCLWANSNLDIAIIKCERTNIPHVNAVDRVIDSNDPLKLLEPVIAIGTPIDFAYQNSCTLGYVSGLDRYSVSASSNGLSENVYENLIQHTASISNGNSGGGLFDLDGNLIGLNTLGSQSANDMYFAVPIYPVLLVLDDVVSCYEQNAEYSLPTLGVSVLDKTVCEIYGLDTITQDGLYVSSVSGNAQDLIQVGDIINSITFMAQTYEINCRNDLIYALMQLESGDVVSIELLRQNTNTTVEVELG